MKPKVTQPLPVSTIQGVKNPWGCKCLWQQEDGHRIRMLRIHGFTLLEILVTIIISAVLAVILVQVMSNQPGRSFQVLDAYNDSLALKTAMENITADYRQLIQTQATPLIRLQDNLNGENGFAGYWDPSEPVSATHYCLDLRPSADETPGLEESNRHNECTMTDTILKVKLQLNGQNLVALFTLY